MLPYKAGCPDCNPDYNNLPYYNLDPSHHLCNSLPRLSSATPVPRPVPSPQSAFSTLFRVLPQTSSPCLTLNTFIGGVVTSLLQCPKRALGRTTHSITAQQTRQPRKRRPGCHGPLAIS
eukprot:366168-Chlamydomonas_euryale.AAC.3